MILAYLSGPIRIKDEKGAYVLGDWWGMRQNIKKAEFVAAHLWKNGISVICPHKNTEGMDGLIPDELFLQGDAEQVKRADCIVLLPGWKKSSGCIFEKTVADKHGIKVINVEDPEVFTDPKVVAELASAIKVVLTSESRAEATA